MGLAVEVGLLADQLVHDPEGAEWIRESLAEILAALEGQGLPGFEEPTSMPEVPRRGAESYPYSFLHYLRRAFALVREGRELGPTEDLTPADDTLIEEASLMLDSHLLCHSDCEGFYVPVDFAEPIFEDEIPGQILGSSHGLRRELLEVAPALGIEVSAERPTEDALDDLEGVEEGEPFWREKVVWLSLWEAADLSIEHGTMIAFC